MTDTQAETARYAAIGRVHKQLAQAGGANAIAQMIGRPVAAWARQCHAISLAIVKTGILGPDARVARGTCEGVGGQHSWIAVSGDCYDQDGVIVDPTLWSYVERVHAKLWVGTLGDGRHRPHGAGRIFQWGMPVSGGGEPIDLTPSEPLSRPAAGFLGLLGPLDRRGWITLANAPVEDWPAGEILAAMADTPALAAVVPIDRIGMLTDRNPQGLYR